MVQWARGREAEAEMEPDHGALGSWARGPKGTGRPLKERSSDVLCQKRHSGDCGTREAEAGSRVAASSPDKL